MTLFDDSTAHNFSTITLTEQQNPTDTAAEQAEQAETPAQLQQDGNKPAADDFASALESFTTETEESVGEDHVIKGTVIKLTPTHVVVDIGAKSEGMLPLSEVLDHEGKPRFQP